VEEREGSGVIERYKDRAIHDVWNPATIYRRWLEVEIAYVREIGGAEVAEALESVKPPSPAQVNYYERETGHDVAAFLVALDKNVQAKARKGAGGDLPDTVWNRVRSSLHFRLTSSDVVDTALALGVLRSRLVVEDRVANLMGVLEAFANSISAWEITLGRTHGQLAAPMPADHRWRVLGEMLDRAWTRADAGFLWMDVGKLSGPVGLADPSEGRALQNLGLRDTTATQIVPRDRLAHWAHCLAELATVCEAIVTQVWLLAQAGVGELRVEPNGTVGSSAMPHKVNPVIAENVRGLARMARSLAETLQLGIVQWGEHDLAHSSVERVSVPDLLHLVCTIVSRTATLVSGVSWVDPGRPADYRDSSEDLRALQASGRAYVDAHAALTELYRDGKISYTTTEEGQ
jgi:adenylosuccinate lyase